MTEGRNIDQLPDLVIAAGPPALTLSDRIGGWFWVHRPFMLILVVLGSAVGYMLSTLDIGDPVVGKDLLWGLLGVFLVCAGTDVTHEAWDVEVDRINKPYRPIPSGTVGPKAAFIVGFTEFGVGIVVGFSVSVTFGLFLVFMAAMTTHYSWRGKFIPFVGTLESTLGSALVPFSGAMIVPDFVTILPLCIFIWLFEVGRWMMVNIEDTEADLARGRTAVHVLGKKYSATFGLVFYLFALLVTFMPWFQAGHSLVWKIGSNLFALALVAFWIWSATEGHSEVTMHFLHRNMARVLIVAYQVILILESFI